MVKCAIWGSGTHNWILVLTVIISPSPLNHVMYLYSNKGLGVFLIKIWDPLPPKGPGSYENDYEVMRMIDEQRLYMYAM